MAPGGVDAPKQEPTQLDALQQQIEGAKVGSGEKVDPAKMPEMIDEAYRATVEKFLKDFQKSGDTELADRDKGLQKIEAQRNHCHQQLLELQSREQADTLVVKERTVAKIRAVGAARGEKPAILSG